MRRFDVLMTGTGPTGSLSPGLLLPAEGSPPFAAQTTGRTFFVQLIGRDRRRDIRRPRT
jgi:hypothetical protein